MDLCELFQQKKCVLSFEVFPPKKSSGVESIYRTLDELCALRPDFISVTFGAGGTGVKDNLTVELAGAIRARGVEPLAHLTCINSDEETLLGLLDRLEEAGVRNILALRGDRVEGAEEGPYRHANELMERIARRGGFNLVGACYPECHCEAPDALHDLQNLRRKQEAVPSTLSSPALRRVLMGTAWKFSSSVGPVSTTTRVSQLPMPVTAVWPV